MKPHFQKSRMMLSSVLVLLACSLLTPGNDKTTQANPSDQQGTPQNPTSPADQPLNIPTARLLIGSGTDNRSLQWHIVKLPDQTVEAYPALGSDATTYVNEVSISPDFAHLAFVRKDRTDGWPTGTLYVIDTSTGVPSEVPANGMTDSSRLSWSLDGQWLSYIGEISYILHPFAYNLPTGNVIKKQVDSYSNVYGQALSPNGDRLVYVCDQCTESGLYMTDTQGTNQRFLTKGLYSFIVWHPDGTRLYLAEQLVSGMAPHVYRFDLATGTKTEIPGADYLFYPLMLSPNGKLLAYNDSKRGLTFINTEDDSILPVSFSISLGGYWSPDSRYICNFSDPGRYVYLLDVQTGGRAQIDLGVPDSEVYGWLP